MTFTPLKPRQMVKILEKAGFTVKRQTGSHLILLKTGIKRPITVPLHLKDLPTGTQRAILRQAEITLEEFARLKISK